MKNQSRKTTFAGLIGALCLGLEPVAQHFFSRSPIDWSLESQSIIGAIVVAILGYFAKDYNVTGGSIQQPNN